MSMIEVEVNGEQHRLPPESTISVLLESMGLQDKRVAVELNLEIVPRSQHSERILASGDRLEVVHAIGGG
ncbi:sulfur carrier protein ThiS [Pokkaliibacter sp. CJK22405]|uniref:sulfur carrier protein ThiS n=1 Tax=Pokkaliibacter sp. CJK22405 TaxID=3384615 RepID=UPI003984E877